MFEHFAFGFHIAVWRIVRGVCLWFSYYGWVGGAFEEFAAGFHIAVCRSVEDFGFGFLIVVWRSI